jgi:L-cysteine/cystine lyase
VLRFAELRAMIAGIDDVAYFQTSGFSPKPAPVLDEVVHWMRFQARGPALPAIADACIELVEQTRADVAALINAAPDEVMLNENATVGINIVANGIAWRPGDVVLLSDHEHPGNRVVWYEIARRHDVQLRFLPLDGEDDDQLLRAAASALNAPVRIASLSHVSRRSGRVIPARQLSQLCARAGVPLLLDGAQAFGAIPVDVAALGCDFYVLSGHKYILGPQATGALYVRRDRLDWLRPSWLGSRSQQTMDQHGGLVLHPAARRFEFGTRNIGDIAGLRRALQLIEAVGQPAWFAGIAERVAATAAALAPLPGVVIETPGTAAQRGGMVCLRVAGLTGGEVYHTLLERERILVSPFEPGTATVRVSLHGFITDHEIGRLAGAIAALAPATVAI